MANQVFSSATLADDPLNPGTPLPPSNAVPPGDNQKPALYYPDTGGTTLQWLRTLQQWG